MQYRQDVCVPVLSGMCVAQTNADTFACCCSLLTAPVSGAANDVATYGHLKKL